MCFDQAPLLLANHANGDLRQIADHALHVAAVVAHFGVLGRLHFKEWRADQLGQPSGDLSFADARRSDHNDVLGGDVFAQVFGQLLPPPAIANGHRYRPLGRILPDDVPVQLLDDLPRRQFSHS